MPAHLMLDPSERAHTAVQFADRLAARGIILERDAVKAIGEHASRNMYGPVLAANLVSMAEDPRDTDPRLAFRAAGVLTAALSYSERLYVSDDDRQRPPSFWETPDFTDSLTSVQEAMAKGKFHYIDEPFAMTAREGRMQVRRADLLLGGPYDRDNPQNVQSYLAGHNYDLFFSQDTMAGAEDIDRLSIEEALARGAAEQMGHLIRGNWAIAGLVSGLARQHHGELNVIDWGAGRGGTSAKIVGELLQHADDINFDRLSMTLVETTPGFAEALRQFGPKAVTRLTEAGIPFDFCNDPHVADSHEPGTISLIEGDILGTARRLPPTSGDALTVMVANFVAHRMPTAAKSKLFELAAGHQNIVFGINDLKQNASELNLRYFNLTNNGPLNAGNLGLTDLFRSHGFEVIEFSQDRDKIPSFINPELATAIADSSKDDGHMWVAYKGELASKYINERARR